MTIEELLACFEDRPCAVCFFHTDRCNRWTCVFEDEIEEQQPKTGKWIFHKPFDDGHKNCNGCIECSQCHTWFGHDCYAKTPYCPNCGAKMEVEK